MKTIVKLPFDLHVYTKMYQNLSFPLGIIMGNTQQDITPWLCSRYTNCRYFESYPRSKFNLVLDDMWTHKENILTRQVVILEPETYKQLDLDPVKLFQSMLSLGFYPYGYYNEQYIPGKASYQKGYFYHDYLLIGYNDSKKCFLSVGYLQGMLFQEFDIPYDCMRNAILSTDVPKIILNFAGYNQDYKFTLNLSKIKSNLRDYLNSTSYLPIKDERWYGIAAIRKVMNDFETSLVQKERMDTRYSRGYMEHKFFLNLCCQYLNDKGYIRNPTALEKSKKVYEIAQRIHLMVLKYNLTGKEETGRSVLNHMNDIIEAEQQYIPHVIKEMEDCM